MLQFYDFFAGVGMAELGLAPKWECLWANDIDPKKAAIHQLNFGASGRFRLDDVNLLHASDLPGHADMAWASFPCQDLSLAGWRRGLAASRSGTFWAFHRIMNELNDQNRMPPMLVLENVVGLLYDKDFAGLCEALADMGYQFGALVVDAKHFLPQSRPRVFVVAVDAQLEIDAFTTDGFFASDWFPSSLHRAHAQLNTDLKSRWRWWRLPVPPQSDTKIGDLISLDQDEVSWNDETQNDYLLSLMSDTNLQKVEEARRANKPQIGLLYRRTRKDGQKAEVRFDGIAGCLRTATGGSSRQTVLIVDGPNIRSRLLTPSEAARLMGVPNTFQLVGSFNDRYRSMGDGVAVPVVRWLGDHLLTPMAVTLRLQEAPPFEFEIEGARMRLLPEFAALSAR